MNKKLFIGLSGGFFSIFPQTNAQAIAIGLSPSSANIELGNQVDVDLIISDLGDGFAPSLGAFDFNVNFDSTILDFSSLTFGDPILGDQLNLFSYLFGLDSINGFMEVDDSTVNLFEISLDWPQDLDDFQVDSFTLATLTFNTIGEGTSNLDLNNVILGDAFGAPLTAEIVNSSVTVIPRTVPSVPEPTTTIGLLLLGVMVITRQVGGKTTH